jgi:hypothetical protein
MARPNIPDHLRKRTLVQLRLTEEEKAKLIYFAKMAGVTLTDFVKARTLNKPPRIRKANYDRELMIKYLAELGKVGSNVNQIARHMNTPQKGHYSVTVKETYIAQVLEAIEQLANRIFKELEIDNERGHTG